MVRSGRTSVKVLFVLTNHSAGFWLSELTHPYRELVEQGVEVDYASPRGGVAPFSPYSDPNYPMSLEPDDEVSRRFLKDHAAVERLKQTIPLASLASSDYEAIHLVGGLGTAHDFYPDTGLGRLIEVFWAEGKVVSAICHGVLGLANATLGDVPLVRGRRVTAYSLEEDLELERRYAMKTPVVPHYPQVVLEEAGALFEAKPPRTPHVVRDGKLLTGQNQQSSTPLAVALAGMLAGE
jgi:putative intracellular protease/amidase